MPILETVRRWGTWWEFPPAYLDDLLIGGFLLIGTWMSQDNSPTGARWLSAAYGFACGIGLMSLITNLVYINHPDPFGVSGLTASIVKVGMISLGFAGLAGSIAGPRTDSTR